jgi:hypothetical protein
VKFKPGVTLALQPEFTMALPAIDRAYEEITGQEAVMTSGTDGKHMEGSLHAKGLAGDYRIRDPGGAWSLTQAQIEALVKRLRLLLNKDETANRPFQVIVETDHLHVEYQPR